NRYELKIGSNNNVVEITKDDIKQVIEEKTKIPIYEINSVSINKFNKLSSILKDKICGQDNIIDELIKATKRFKLGLSSSKKPISFLFVGPTGVGKTELVKEYANLLFNTESLIRLDMSEFREAHTISKLIGSPPGYVGYEDNNHLLEKVRDNPHSVILLDEIEKASPMVLNLFLQILDDGKIKDSKGNVIHFDNTIIIMTSNAVKDLADIGFVASSNLISNLENSFSTEFLNRINHILLFNRLDEENIRLIIKNKLLRMKKEYKDKGIKIVVDKNIIDEVISISDYNKFGARKITKILEDKINNIVADNILDNVYKIKIDSVLN
ncbi:MAG: ATP-dependent Clp protease ATP-binding subunit, partial [Bacilli bacterium]|nr:ATP-dependent Clp protease ATP-binding subunit [Bacilli bacterium]